MKRAIAIARVSSDEQAREDRTSLDTQLADIGKWCAQYGYEVVEEIREAGVSVAGPLDPKENPRPFWRAYDRLKAGEVDAIVFWRSTRFSRDARALRMASIIDGSREYGTGIVFADAPPPSADNEMGQVDAFMRAFTSSIDAKNRREATARGVRAKWENGQWASGHLPLGYAWEKETKQLVVDPAGAELVRFVFNAYLQGRQGTKLLANQFNEQGVRPPSSRKGWANGGGALWTSATVSRILRAEFYWTGNYVRTYAQGSRQFAVEPLIDEATFKAAQALRETRPSVGKRPDGVVVRRNGIGDGRTGHRELLQGLIRCGVCGRRWRTDIPEGGRRPVYSCTGRYKPHDPRCAMPRIPTAKLNDVVWQTVAAAVKDGTSLRVVAERYLRRLEERIATRNPEIVRSAAELETLRAERARAVLVEIKYGVDQTETVASLDERIAGLDLLLGRHQADRAALDELRRERDRMQQAIASYGGMDLLGEDDEDRERVLVAYERPAGGRRFRAARTERIPKADILDMLGTRVTVFADHVTVEGAVNADQSVGHWMS